MVVAPSSTVDMDTASGDAIEIEERDPGEMFAIGGVRTAALDITAWNPVFDVTPHDLIDAIVTEKGVIERPDEVAMRSAFGA
jgi:methylthioribose-1-phosphate isomerase